MGILIHAGLWYARRRGREVLHGNLIHNDVDLPCIPHSSTHPLLRLGSYGSMGWYVYRLDGEKHLLRDKILHRRMAEKKGGVTAYAGTGV